MKTSVLICIATILVMIINSCGILGIDKLLSRGHYNENMQFVPKHPKYKLKDKQNNIIPKNLDTVNVYREVKMINFGKTVPASNPVSFIKFYPNGRCLSFTASPKEDFGKVVVLEEDDLNPNYPFRRKEYYYSEDGKRIQIEVFLCSEGCGYIRLNYFLSESGNILKLIEKDMTIIYIKEEIPKDWKKYSVDW